jgi:hypothetical protein
LKQRVGTLDLFVTQQQTLDALGQLLKLFVCRHVVILKALQLELLVLTAAFSTL